ncbi:MAG: hypothetical protein Q8W46_12985 [Candidatus Palauibacterales bacterium]|nr:hypothetical protein [Candidatus Palauibacterales bacterium]
MDRRSDRVIRWLLPTLGALLVVAAYVFTLFLRGGSLFAGDGDPGRHIRVGSYILEHRAIPHVDVFSHTMRGQHFIPFEWLSEVLAAAAHAIAGLAGVAVLTAALFAATVGVVYVAIRRSGVPAPIAFAFGFLTLILTAIHLHPRPHMFTTALLAVFSLVLLEVRRGAPRRWLLALPVLMAAWVNLHGGFLVGFILLGAFASDAVVRWTRDRQSAESRTMSLLLLATLAACLLVSLANPAGWRVWPHAIGYLRLTWLIDFTQEYKSPDFHNTLVKIFLLSLLLGTGVLGLVRSRIDPLGLGLWLLFMAFALHSVRNVPLFAVVCMPWLASWTCQALRERPDGRGMRFWNWAVGVQRADTLVVGWPVALLALLLLTRVAVAPGWKDEFAFAPDVFPVAAVAELQSSNFVPPGPVYNEFRWGGYLLYAWPEVPVFIDGQTDFYGEKLTQEYRGIRFIEPGWRLRLRERNVAWVMVPPTAPLAGALALLDDWDLRYSDSTAVVWVRKN